MSDIQFTQGEDVEVGLTLTDSSDVAINITGDTFDAKIKDMADIDTELASFSFAITDGAAGKVSFYLTDVQTLAIPPTVIFNAKGAETSTPDRLLFYDIFRVDHTTSLKKVLTSGVVKIYPCMSYDGV